MINSGGNTRFAEDATFHEVAGLADLNWISYQSHNYSARYIRRICKYLILDIISTDQDSHDATFRKVN